MPSEQLVYPYLTGTNIVGSGFNTTCTVTNGSATVTGQFTIWETALDKGDVLFVGGTMGLVQEVVSDTELTLATPWAGPTAAAAPYAAYRNNSYVDPRNYGRRLAEYLTTLRGIPDDLPGFIAQLQAIQAAIDADATQVAADKAAAAGSASAAAGSATAAAGSATTAGTAATSATAAWNSFRAIYYGPLASDPSVDPLGNPPNDGDIYYNTTAGSLRLCKGGAWVTAVFDPAGALIAANNLSDLPNKATARTNLGLGSMAVANTTDYIAKTGGAFTGALSATVYTSTASRTSGGGFKATDSSGAWFQAVWDTNIHIGSGSALTGVGVYGEFGTGLQISGSNVGIKSTGGGGLFVQGDDNLVYYIGTSAVWSAQGGWVSDANLKTNIVDISNPLDTVKQMRGVTFNWLNDPEGKGEIGFVAQEIEQVLPRVVSEIGGTKLVAYQQVVPLLVEAIKELAARVEALEAQGA